MTLAQGDDNASEAEPASEVLFEDTVDSDASEPEALVLTAEAGGERLDKWLAGQLPDRSRAEIQRWIETGLVTRNGKTLKSSYRLAPGDVVELLIPPVEDYEAEPEDIPLVHPVRRPRSAGDRQAGGHGGASGRGELARHAG